MKTRIKVVTLLAVLLSCLFGSGLFAQTPKKVVTPAHHLQQTYETAQHTGNDIDLAAFVAESIHAPVNNVPDVAWTHLVTLIVRAQRQYEEGRISPITESQVANLANQIMTALQAPEWAFTSTQQVHTLRFGLLLREIFMKENFTLGVQDSQLSPIQAAHLLSILITQKQLNPHYQTAEDIAKHTASFAPNRALLDLLHGINLNDSEAAIRLFDSVSTTFNVQ